MTADALPGYRGRLREVLSEAGAGVGDIIQVESDGGVYEGVLMPRVESADDLHIVIKLKSGYNVGVAFNNSVRVKRVGEATKPEFKPPPIPEAKEGLPRVSIVSTGGTIASRVDYVTGGVYAAISSRDLLSIVPELADIARVEADILYSVFSENINSSHWSVMARRAKEKIKEGCSGVVITHGTDTLGYSAAALSFALQNLPVPVVLVGSQRSSDRPSSDSATNLVAAVTVASKAPFAEVVVGMHDTTSDDSVAFHRGTKVRKCHTSARYAFRSVNAEPLARYSGGEVKMLSSDYRRRQSGEVRLRGRFEEKVSLLKFHPDFDSAIIDFLVEKGYRGIVLEGTGLGHVSDGCFEAIERANDAGVVLGMTSQCIWGRVNMNVYSTGRELTRRGVEPLGDMLPETALVKLMWCLGQTKDREKALHLMKANLAGEHGDRTTYAEASD